MSAPSARSKGPGSVAVLLALTLLLSACMGGGAGASKESGDASSRMRADEGRVVEGTVVDEERRPVGGAFVGDADSGISNESDAEGTFRLAGLPASAKILLRAGKAGYFNQTLQVDLQYVPRAEVRFILRAMPTDEARHVTDTGEGEIACQVAFGSHHGFPGFYKQSCGELLPSSKERIQVQVDPGVQAVVLELVWEPQSQAADIMGLTAYLATDQEDLLLGALHNLPGDHYVHTYSGPTATEAAREKGGLVDAFVHVDPSALDEHVPTNAGVVIQQKFTLYTTAFYGAPPAPSWSFVPPK